MTGRPTEATVATRLVLVAVLGVIGGCRPSDRAESAPSASVASSTTRPDIEQAAPPAVVLPDMESLEGWAREKVQQRHAVLESLLAKDPPSSDGELARAYGALGLVLLAAEQYEQAAASFLTAVARAPRDIRWPYYLGQRHVMMKDFTEAAAWFERVLELAPSDEATLVWLGRVYVDQSRFDEADRLFAHATLVAPQSAAAWAGAGHVALAKQEYERAVDSLERALALDPGGSQAHYPLAMAYRSLGDFDRAAASFDRFNAQRFERRRGGRPPLLTDPLMLDYYNVVESAAVFQQRGNQALDDGDHATAIDLFRQGIEREPDNPFIRQRLAAALVRAGDPRAAAEQLEAAVRLEPEFALAHVGLAALMASEGRHQAAIDRYNLALEYDPQHIEARLGLAEALRASGRLEESLPIYAQVTEEEPELVETWIGGGEALIRLGRYLDAREWLNAARRVHPDQPQLQQLDAALARVASR